MKWLALSPSLWVLYRNGSPTVSLSKWPQGWIAGRTTGKKPCILYASLKEAAYHVMKGK